MGGGDLATPSGNMNTGVKAVAAEFESDLFIERTQSGFVAYKPELYDMFYGMWEIKKPRKGLIH